ncbi:hypothetical protein JCM10207_001440 [Rhodosporidiobolus poonsookiae]
MSDTPPDQQRDRRRSLERYRPQRRPRGDHQGSRGGGPGRPRTDTTASVASETSEDPPRPAETLSHRSRHGRPRGGSQNLEVPHGRRQGRGRSISNASTLSNTSAASSASEVSVASVNPPPRPEAPDHSVAQADRERTLARLKRQRDAAVKEAKEAVVHVESIAAGIRRTEGRWEDSQMERTAKATVTTLHSLIEQLNGNFEEEKILLGEAHLESTELCRQVLQPVMLDALLKYLAVHEHDDVLLNMSWPPPRREGDRSVQYNHYPTVGYIRRLADEGELDKGLAQELLRGLEEVKDERDHSMHRAQYERIHAAHPDRHFGFFEQYARALDACTPPHYQSKRAWMDAFDRFVNNKKSRAAEHLGRKQPYNGRADPMHEAEPWQMRQEQHDEEGRPNPRYNDHPALPQYYKP